MSLNLDISLISSIVKGLTIIIISIVIGKVAGRLCNKGARKAGIPESEAVLISTSLSYIVYFIGVIEALTSLGVSFLPLFSAIAIIAIVIGLSAHSTLECVISGYILRVQKPFHVGEIIRIGNVLGTVKDLDLMYVTIETDQKECLRVPNFKVLSSEMLNLTRHKCKFPVELKFTVPVDVDLRDLRLSILEDLEKYRYLSKDTPILFIAKEIKEKEIPMKLRFYVLNYDMINGARDFILEKIVYILKSADNDETKKNREAQNDYEVLLEKHQKTPTCPLCDSKKWAGHLKCSVCSGYFLKGKCLGCNHLRLEKCPFDGGELEFVPSRTEGEK